MTPEYEYLKALSDAYYNTDTPLVNDQQFDLLVAQYELKFGEPFTYLGTTHTKTKLPVFMSSLNKCKDEAAIAKVCAKFHGVSTVYSEKLDGVSLLLVATLSSPSCPLGWKAYTRGDGEFGADVSFLTTQLSLPASPGGGGVTIRGELVIAKSLGLGDNLRNIVSGVVNAKNPNKDILQHLQFVAYSTPTLPFSPSESFSYLTKLGFTIPLLVTSTKCDLAECNYHLTAFQTASKFCIDGLVVARDLYLPILTLDNPKHIVAFKRLGTTQESTVIKVIWQDSRYGTMHPRVQLSPVIIDGCTIAFASGVHAKYIVDNNIGPGTVLEIQRSGEVIPNILRVVSSTTAQLPVNVDYEWEGVNIKVREPQETQLIARLTHSLKILKAKGISEQTVQKLYKAGFTTELLLWRATAKDLLVIDGIKQKSAENIVEALQVSKGNLTLTTLLLLSACFSGFGESKVEKVVGLANLDLARYLTQTHLTEEQVTLLLAEISIVSLSSAFLAGCAAFRQNKDFMELLSTFGTGGAVSPTKAVGSARGTKGTVVFSGFRDKDLKVKSELNGFQVSESPVSKKTTCLVVQSLDSTSNKIEAAKLLGVPVYTKEEFFKKMII
jgi:NAD-dependent DNA ligase